MKQKFKKDINGKSINDLFSTKIVKGVGRKQKSIPITLLEFIASKDEEVMIDININGGTLFEIVDVDCHLSNQDFMNDTSKERAKELQKTARSIEQKDLIVGSYLVEYYYDEEKETIIKRTMPNKIEELGNGTIKISFKQLSETKNREEMIDYTVELIPNIED